MPQGTAARAPGARFDLGRRRRPAGRARPSPRWHRRAAAGRAHGRGAGSRASCRSPSSASAMRAASRAPTSALSISGQLFACRCGDQMHGVAVAAHDAGGGADIVGDDPVAAFLRALGLGMGDDVFGLGGKADDQRRALVADLADRGEDVGIGGELRRDGAAPSSVFLILLLAARSGRQSATAAVQTAISTGSTRFAGRQHLARAFDLQQFHARRRRPVRPGRRPASSPRRPRPARGRWHSPACRRSGWR